MRLDPPVIAPAFEVDGVRGEPVSLARFANQRVWLVLSRYAACPFCSLRLDRLIQQWKAIAETGVQLVVVFPSPVDRIEKYVMRYEPPFIVAADPEERIFGLYGSETSWFGELRTAVNVPKAIGALVHAPNNPFAVDGPIHRMPAEFLIDASGRLVRAHYGRTLDDGFPIDEVIRWATGSEAA